MWDEPTMSISIVDSKKRIVLQSGQPGDVFEISGRRKNVSCLFASKSRNVLYA